MAFFLGTSVGRWCYTCLGRNDKRCWPPGLIKYGNTWALFKEPLIWASKSPSASHGLSNNSKSSVTVRMRCCIWKLHRLYGIMSLEISLRWFGVPPRWKADTYLPVFNIEISRKCHLNKGVLLKFLKPFDLIDLLVSFYFPMPIITRKSTGTVSLFSISKLCHCFVLPRGKNKIHYDMVWVLTESRLKILWGSSIEVFNQEHASTKIKMDKDKANSLLKHELKSSIHCYNHQLLPIFIRPFCIQTLIT